MYGGTHVVLYREGRYLVLAKGTCTHLAKCLAPFKKFESTISKDMKKPIKQLSSLPPLYMESKLSGMLNLALLSLKL